MPRYTAGRSSGYLDLLRNNPNFTRLFFGQIVSQMGDWFNTVALFTLLLTLTGSGEAVGYVLILKLLPTFCVGPLAGVVADRFSRKKIMIVADVARGIVVLGFLFIHSPAQVWIVYTLAALQVIGATFFDPAKSAAIPSIVSREQLFAANAISGASWSVTLAFGAALGGAVTDAFGQNAAFVIDAGSFFISAGFICFVRIRETERSIKEASSNWGLSVADAIGLTDLIEGARYLRSNLRVLAVLLVKSGWGLGGGVLLLLTIFGKQVFPLGRGGSASIGLLYAARGVGALIGPIVARWMTDGSPRTMRRAITIAFFISAGFYLLFGIAPVLGLAMLFVVGAHAGGSIQWVFSTTLLQMAVPNRFLGRVFSLELAMVTLTMSWSTYLTGWALDYRGMSPRQAALFLGLAFVIPGICWALIQERLNTGETRVELDSRPVEASFPP
jgi:MFS family permease